MSDEHAGALPGAPPDLPPRKPKVERWFLVRWPGPGMLKTEGGEDVVIDGVTLRHVYPTREFTLPSKSLEAAKKLGLEIVRQA